MRRASTLVVLWCLANAATAGAETYAVRVVHDLPYLQGARREAAANDAGGKDTLDLYLPEGRRNAPVIVWYYGNQLMGGDKSEDAFIADFTARGSQASRSFLSAVISPRPSRRRPWTGRFSRSRSALSTCLKRWRNLPQAGLRAARLSRPLFS